MRWIIVSNRLPFQVVEGEIKRSSGGLVTALSGVHSAAEQIWVGIAPTGLSQENWAALPENYHVSYRPVFVAPEAYDAYYNGISNDVFWPLFHYESSMIKVSNKEWEAYRGVNAQIAQEVASQARPEDVIWVHDFHLFLLPQMLRDLGVRCKIGFFLHIPFPSSELFRQLPMRSELLEGLLGSDLIGFHDYSYLRHFSNTVLNVLNVNTGILGFNWKNRKVSLGVYPVSIDFDFFQKASKEKETQLHFERFRATRAYRHLILGVDRLDYSKGLILKLQAFQKLLEDYPSLRGEVSLLQIAVPTRQDVEEYQKLRAEVERMIGEINGAFSRPNYVPVQYMYRSVEFKELLALYQLADVLLVSSKRDGMNLVALEYIVTQSEDAPGVVVLSEFTGASSMLSSALPINPWDISGTALQLYAALDMTRTEKWMRIQTMQTFLEGYTASDWASSFIQELMPREENIKNWQQTQIQLEDKAALNQIFPEQENLVLFLDYDGTLVPIVNRPEDARLPQEIRDVLVQLLQHPKIQPIIVSGRDAGFLDQEFAGLALTMACEHGAQIKVAGQDWQSLVWSEVSNWYEGTRTIMEDYQRLVPNSHVEFKQFGIAWHYRQSPQDFAQFQARKLKEELETVFSNLPVTVISGNKVIEARAMEANKGYFVKHFLTEFETQADIVAIGDDVTDEEMFASLPDKAVSIKVGLAPTRARYRISEQAEVLKLLKHLAQRS